MMTGRSVEGENGTSLKVAGDDKGGYDVIMLYKGQPISSACSWVGDSQHITLTGTTTLAELDIGLNVRVEYQVLSSHLVRKRVELHQVDAHLLYYQVTNALQPANVPAQFWSFDQPDCKGGPLYENYPAAGFRTPGKLTVGLLTGTGYRTGWSRIIRRDNGEFIKPAPGEIPDVNLYYIPTPDRRSKQDFVVRQTFGELLAVCHQPGISCDGSRES